MFTLAPTRRREKNNAGVQLRCVVLSLLFVSAIFANNPALLAQGLSSRSETFDLIPGGQVRIENLRGSTRVEVWDTDTVRVLAEKKTPAGAALDPTDLVLM